MAKKKEAKKKELAIVSEELINGARIVTYEDGSVDIFPAVVHLTAEQASNLFSSDDEDEDDEDSDEDEDDEDEDDEDEDSEDEDDSEEDEDDDSDEDEDDSDDEDDEPLTAEALAKMDFEELEDVCDDKDLDTDPDDFEEEDVEKLRKEIAKELGLKLPKAAAKGKGKKKK